MVKQAISRPRARDVETVHLTPWDLRRITGDYIQKGVVLPKPSAGVEHLASSFARAVGHFYPLAGRFAVAAVANDGTESPSRQPGLAISLRCSDEGAEFVHAVAPGVTVADITGALCTPRVVWSFFPLNGVLGTDAVVDPSLPLLAAQVTDLADGVFIAMSLNHGAADGTTFWDLFNRWSQISRNKSDISTVLPLQIQRWFHEGCPLPIPLPFAKVQDMGRPFEYPPVQECSVHFSPESIKKLKAKANAEMATATISSLQALLAHLWRAVCRARGLAPDVETTFTLPVGCRTRMTGIRKGYVGTAVASAVARTPVGEILGEGRLGWTAWRLNRAVASVDEASLKVELASWSQNPSFRYSADHVPSAVLMSGSPRFDVYGNDFGWGRPVAVRSGAGSKLDGMVTVYEDGGGRGGMELQVCLAPDVLATLVADEELMDASTGVGVIRSGMCTGGASEEGLCRCRHASVVQ
uniref:Acetyltransferase n=1 Tax=Hordeum vulgare subsp. vulgare TaxID=112509 RepID=A0A8I6W9B3_HORVV